MGFALTAVNMLGKNSIVKKVSSVMAFLIHFSNCDLAILNLLKSSILGPVLECLKVNKAMPHNDIRNERDVPSWIECG